MSRPRAVEFGLRPARTGEAGTLHDLARTAYAPYVERIGREPAPMNADYEQLIADGHAWLADAEGQVIGFIVLVPANDYLLVENIAVTPQRQGLGVGAALLDFAEDRARVLNLPQLRLYTNAAMTENLEYYPRRGFAETHRRPQDGFDRVFFSKPVARLAATHDPVRPDTD
jgi:GNAT superfamily N-acetyltransferase